MTLSTLPDETLVRQVLNDCVGAMQAMQLQIEQMRGLFVDSDGTIAEALAAGDAAQSQAGELLQQL